MVNKCCISVRFIGQILLVEDSATGYLTHQETVKCFTRKRELLFFKIGKHA